MKKVTYDKSGIMKDAWNLFNNEDFTIAEFEYADVYYYENGKMVFFEKTFSLCLKEAWGREKDVVDGLNQKYADAETSEEVKAWDWACKKLGVTFEMDAYTKMVNVENMEKEAWPGTSVWSLAMRAVKLCLETVAA